MIGYDEMHSAKLIEAVKARRHFSIWRPGQLVGTTFNPCSDCLILPGGGWRCDMNCGSAICPKCKANITLGEICRCKK